MKCGFLLVVVGAAHLDQRFYGLGVPCSKIYIIDFLTFKHKAASGAGEDIYKAVPEYYFFFK